MTSQLRRTLIITVTIFFSACSDNTKEDRKVITFNKGNGEKAIISCIIKGADTVYDGIAKYYYSNGTISDEILYVLNKKEGLQLHYDSTGRIISKVPYKDGRSNGTGIFFNEHDNIQEENTYFKGKLYFAKWYYSNGKFRMYTAMNDSLPFYIVRFDTLGRKESEKGFAFSISDDCFSVNIDSVGRNESVEATIPLAAIPGYSLRMEAARFDSIGNMIGLPDTIPIHNYYALYKTRFEKPGKYRLGIAGELKDENGRILRQDTLLVHITVIPDNSRK